MEVAMKYKTSSKEMGDTDFMSTTENNIDFYRSNTLKKKKSGEATLYTTIDSHLTFLKHLHECETFFIWNAKYLALKWHLKGTPTQSTMVSHSPIHMRMDTPMGGNCLSPLGAIKVQSSMCWFDLEEHTRTQVQCAHSLNVQYIHTVPVYSYSY